MNITVSALAQAMYHGVKSNESASIQQRYVTMCYIANSIYHTHRKGSNRFAVQLVTEAINHSIHVDQYFVLHKTAIDAEDIRASIEKYSEFK